jgi:OOP family OmpA-OmpF porin
MKRKYLGIIILGLVMVMAFGCATQQAAKKPMGSMAYTVLNAKLQSGEYRQKATTFLVILDTSGTMQETFRGKPKINRAKDFVRGLDQTIPDITLIGGMRTLGQYFSNSTRRVYGMKAYSRGDLSKALTTINVGGMTPLGGAIKAGTGDLSAGRGNMAVIVVSDGIDTDKTSVKMAQAMKAKYGDRVCIYTVLVGDAAGARVRMAQIAKAGGCGFATTALMLSSKDAMVDFVTKVFLERAPGKAPVKIGDADGDGVPDNIDQCPNTPRGAKVDERGCWAYEAVVLFDFDSAKLRSEAYGMLDDAAAVLKESSNIRIEIQGHTCSLGPEDYNQKLSESRAKAVMNYFESKGISAGRMTVEGYGETKPAYSNTTKEGRAKNRRVELRPMK